MQKMKEYRHMRGIYLERYNGLSPLRKLNQGFSYVSDTSGKTVTSVQQVNPGDRIEIAVTDGIIKAEVTESRREDREA